MKHQQNTYLGKLNGAGTLSLHLHAYHEDNKLVKIRFEFGMPLLDIAEEIKQKYNDGKLNEDFTIVQHTNLLCCTIAHCASFSSDEGGKIDMEFATQLPEFSLAYFRMNLSLSVDKNNIIFERNNRN